MTGDEISLYDLWRVFIKHKYLFVLIFALVLIIGIVVIKFKPVSYKYTQTLKIAGYMDDGELVTFNSTPNIVKKITDVYWPTVLKKYNLGGNGLSVTDIDSGEIILATRGILKQQPIYTKLFTGVLRELDKDASPLVQSEMDFLTKQLAILQKQLALQMNIDKNLAEGPRNSDVLIQQLIVSNQQQSVLKLTAKEAKIHYKLSTLQNDHFTSGLIRSGPVGISKSVFLLLIIIMAAIVGFMAVFIREFFAQINHLEKYK